jgi:hypothetical protein
MSFTGRCYCGAVRYEADGPPGFKGQCHCRECQYITGGAENVFMIVPSAGFRYVQGAPKTFTRGDIENAVTREFCGECGTHITTRVPRDPSIVILKVGTLDDPSVYGGPQAAIWMSEAQPYHLVPEGVMTFPGFPGR